MVRFRWYLLLVFLPFLVACPSKVRHFGPGDSGWGLKIQWYGHSCFSFTDSTGRVVLIDPFDSTVGYRQPQVEPHVVLVTHQHFDHNYVRIKKKRKYKVICSTGNHNVCELDFFGGLSFHDDVEGMHYGKNNLYVWNMGGLRVAHLGDVGQKNLTEDQLKLLGHVDILMVPVGGKPTISADGAKHIVKQIKPSIVIPMHYGNPQVRFYGFDPVEPFLDLFKRVIHLEESEFHIRRSQIPSQFTVYVPALPGEVISDQ